MIINSIRITITIMNIIVILSISISISFIVIITIVIVPGLLSFSGGAGRSRAKPAQVRRTPGGV